MTAGSIFMPIILGSDKTTMSIGTGNNAYYPLYLSIRNVCNHIRHAHRDALVLVGFLAIPKSRFDFLIPHMNTYHTIHLAKKEHLSDRQFRKFRCQLFHSSLSAILNSLRPGMRQTEVVKFGDGHFRHVIYDFGPYIYCRLRGTGAPCVHCTWMVCKVSGGSLCLSYESQDTRCQERTWMKTLSIAIEHLSKHYLKRLHCRLCGMNMGLSVTLWWVTFICLCTRHHL